MSEQFSDLLGKTLVEIKGSVGEDLIVFVTSDGERYQLWHEQNCCELVYIQDIIGNLSDLIDFPLLMAEEISNADEPEGVEFEYRDNSETWTFYKLATAKGYVTIRWYGSSNGYHSESVDFCKIS